MATNKKNEKKNETAETVAPVLSAKAQLAALLAQAEKLQALAKEEEKTAKKELVTALNELCAKYTVTLATLSTVCRKMADNNGVLPDIASLTESAERSRKVCSVEERKLAVAEVKEALEAGKPVMASVESVAVKYGVARETVYGWSEVKDLREERAKRDSVAASVASK